jgi:hypothetical protein
MEKKYILAVCAHRDILQTIARLIENNPEWVCVAAPGYDEARDHLATGGIDLVLLGSGIDPADEQSLIIFCREQHPPVVIVQHFGGGSGLLFAEIYGGLDQK